MRLASIYTNRKLEKAYFWDIVYEWEDAISETLEIDLINYNKCSYKLSKIIFNKYARQFVNSKLTQTFNDKTSLAFFMDIYGVNNFILNKNVIPIIIDFWGRHLKNFSKIYSDSKIVYVTSMEAYNKIMSENLVSVNLKYIPLSIADKWIIGKNFKKTIDILQIGRRNPVLHNFAIRYAEENPEAEYIYQEYIDNKPQYVSTQKGIIGEIRNRQEYMNMLSKAKISLVSSPGMDSSKQTQGFNPVTPRFYESAINYCYMIGRYPDNDDFKECNIDLVCNKVDNYDEFKKFCRIMLNQKFSQFEKYDRFIKDHLTSCVAKKIMNDLMEENIL